MSLSQRRHFTVHSSILLNGGNRCKPLSTAVLLWSARFQSWWHFCPSCFVCFLHRDHCCHDCRMRGSRSFSFSRQLCLFAFNSSPQSLWQTFVEQWTTCVWEIDFDLPRPFLHSRTHFDGKHMKKAVECFRFLQDHDLVNPSANRKIQSSHCCHVFHCFVFFSVLTSLKHSSRNQVKCSCQRCQSLLSFSSLKFRYLIHG